MSSETVFSTKKKKTFLASLRRHFWPETHGFDEASAGLLGPRRKGGEPVCFAHSLSIPVIDVSTGHVDAGFGEHGSPAALCSERAASPTPVQAHSWSLKTHNDLIAFKTQPTEALITSSYWAGKVAPWQLPQA